MNRLQTILVGTDFSQCSASALAQAARVARWNNANLHVIHVIQNLVIEDLAAALRTRESDLTRRVLDDARSAIDDALRTVKGAEGAVVHIEVGSPINEILEKVEQLSADLLVVGVTGVSGTRHGAGSLALKCVRQVPAKVMLVHETHTEPFRRVMACTDFSDVAELALAQAIRVAQQDESQLNVLHVYQGPWHRLHYRAPTPQAAPDYQRQYKAALSARLESCLEPHTDDLKNLEVKLELFDYPHYGGGIVEYARKSNADLIVLGTQGRTSLRYVLLGSTAERVLREVPCSILAIKRPEQRSPLK